MAHLLALHVGCGRVGHGECVVALQLGTALQGITLEHGAVASALQSLRTAGFTPGSSWIGKTRHMHSMAFEVITV